MGAAGMACNARSVRDHDSGDSTWIDDQDSKQSGFAQYPDCYSSALPSVDGKVSGTEGNALGGGFLVPFPRYVAQPTPATSFAIVKRDVTCSGHIPNRRMDFGYGVNWEPMVRVYPLSPCQETCLSSALRQLE